MYNFCTLWLRPGRSKKQQSTTPSKPSITGGDDIAFHVVVTPREEQPTPMADAGKRRGNGGDIQNNVVATRGSAFRDRRG
jgi:hypothetical protein